MTLLSGPVEKEKGGQYSRCEEHTWVKVFLPRFHQLWGPVLLSRLLPSEV